MEPTCSNTLVQTTAEAHIIMYAVVRGLRPLVQRRPGNELERSSIRSGAVFVWEEGSGIERWTDRREWGDSRSREDFLFYTEGPKASQRSYNDPYLDGSSQWSSRPGQDPLIKQTYTATTLRPEGERKWHMIAYFTEGTKHRLHRVSDHRELRDLVVPQGTFRQARLPKSRRLRERAYSSAHAAAHAASSSSAPTDPDGMDVDPATPGGGGGGGYRRGAGADEEGSERSPSSSSEEEVVRRAPRATQPTFASFMESSGAFFRSPASARVSSSSGARVVSGPAAAAAAELRESRLLPPLQYHYNLPPLRKSKIDEAALELLNTRILAARRPLRQGRMVTMRA